MGRIIKIVAALLLFIYPLNALADMRILPEWQLLKSDGNEYACYAFEAAKELKKADLKCAENQSLLSLREQEIKKSNESKAIDDQILSEVRGQVSELKQQNKSLIESNIDLTSSLEGAQERDIFGGALPWVITGGAIVFAGGLLAGFFMAKD